MSLAGLPNELLAMICDYSDKHALEALRLTNQRISIPATTRFAKRFVGSFAVLMITQSLERLITICEHPMFGPAVDKIHVTFSRVQQERVADLELGRNWLINTKGTIDEVSKAHHRLRCCKRRSKDEAELQKTGKAVELLSRAFSALQPYRTLVELRSAPMMRSRMDFIRLYWYMDKKSNDLAEIEFNLEDFSDREMRVFNTLDALTFEAPWRVPDSVFLSVTNILMHTPKLFALDLKHYTRFGIRGSKPSRTPSERFELGDYALRAVRSDELFEVRLSNMAFSGQCLLDLLDHHQDALTQLSLEKCTLRNGAWTDIISYIKDKLLLVNRLELTCLYDAGPRTPKGSYLTYEPAVRGMGKTKVEGEERVQVALQAMIQRPLKDPTAPEDQMDNEFLH